MPILHMNSHSRWGALLRLVNRPLHHKKGHPQAIQSLPAAFCSLSFPRRTTAFTNSHPIWGALLRIVDRLFSYHVLLRYACLPPSPQHAGSSQITQHVLSLKRRSPPGAHLPVLEKFQPLFASRCPLFPIIDINSHPGRKRFTLPPEPLVMLMMHYWLSITPPASQHPKNCSCSLPSGQLFFSLSPTRL